MDGDLERIVGVFKTMGFNDAAFRRRYAIAPDVAVASLFDEESVILAAKNVLEGNGRNFEAIQAAGYDPVICEVFRLKNCLQRQEVEISAVPPRPLLPDVPWPLTRTGKKKQISKKRKRQQQNELLNDTQNYVASTSTVNSNEEGPQLHQEALAITVDRDEEGDENFAIPECLELSAPPLPPSPPPPLPVRQDFEWRIVAEGRDDRELVDLVHLKLESVPMSAELVRFSREENAGVLDFVSGPLAEIFFRACMASSPLPGGEKLTLDRQYSLMEIPFIDFLLQGSQTRLVYFRGGGTGWTESFLKKFFQLVVPEAEDVKSLHIFPGNLDAVIELSKDVEGDLFFYRCGMHKYLEAISPDTFICRSEVPLHLNDTEKEHVQPDTKLTSDSVESVFIEDNAVTANREKTVDSTQKQPQILRDSVQQTPVASSRTGNVSRDKCSQYREELFLPKPKRCDDSREGRQSYDKYPNLYRNRRLVICRPKEIRELENLETYLQSLLCKIMPGESCDLSISKEGTDVGSLTFSSEDAADAIMDLYVDKPQMFVIGGQPLRIYRGREFIRPGAVNKCRKIVANAKPDIIRVWGLPKLPQGLVKAALNELLDRIFARDPSVTACADALIKKFTPFGDSSLVMFHSAAAGNALLGHKYPVKFGGRALRFERYQDEGYWIQKSDRNARLQEEFGTEKGFCGERHRSGYFHERQQCGHAPGHERQDYDHPPGYQRQEYDVASGYRRHLHDPCKQGSVDYCSGNETKRVRFVQWVERQQQHLLHSEIDIDYSGYDDMEEEQHKKSSFDNGRRSKFSSSHCKERAVLIEERTYDRHVGDGSSSSRARNRC